VSTPEHYRQYALECLRLADGTSEPGAKAVLIDMAQAWIKLADQSEKNRRFELAHPAPPPRQIQAAS